MKLELLDSYLGEDKELVFYLYCILPALVHLRAEDFLLVLLAILCVILLVALNHICQVDSAFILADKPMKLW